MSVAVLLRDLGERGVAFAVVEGRVRVDAPEGVLADADRDRLGAARDELLLLLSVLEVVAAGGTVEAADARRWMRKNGLSRDRARAYLERVGPVTVDDVAERLRIPRADVLVAIWDLGATGAIERCPGSVGGTGLWRLAPAHSTSPAFDADAAWLALDALLDEAEGLGADTLAPPWWEVRAAGEAAIDARSAPDLERACGDLRSRLAELVSTANQPEVPPS